MFFLFSCKNDFSKTFFSENLYNPTKTQFNVLKYLFYYNNINIFYFNKTPVELVLSNQKNFFSFLTQCVFKKVNFYFIISFFKKNSQKALNSISFFQNSSKNSSNVIMFFEYFLSKSLESKIINSQNIFIKPINSHLDFNLNIYPIFVNLSNILNTVIYTNVVKLFIKNANLKKLNLNFLNYFNFFNKILKKNFYLK